jgi:hypothetical protein
VAVGRTVGRDRGVRVASEASVVATASSMGIMGVAVALPGKEQAVINSPALVIIKEYRTMFSRAP